MSTKMVLVGPDYIEVEAVESVTPRMAAVTAICVAAVIIAMTRM